jgi:WD40 repeat protein
MRFTRFSAVLPFSLVVALAGCGGGGGTTTGSTGGSGGSGGGNSFQARPFPGDFFVTPPASESGPSLVGNLVYDSRLKEFFFSNRAANDVEVYSTVDGHRVGAVKVPGAMGLSLSPDGTQMAVGTNTPHIYFVDPAKLHVTGVVAVPEADLDSGAQEPVLPFLMAAGPMLIEATYLSSSLVPGGGNLLSYDPASGTFAPANPPGATVGNGIDSTPARSLDGNYLAVVTSGATGLELTVYSAASQTYIGATPAQYNIRAIAANPDGSQFVTLGTPVFNNQQTITFWSRSFQQQTQYVPQDIDLLNFIYSRDGKYLYLREPYDVLALNAQTGLPAGYQGLSIPNSVGSQDNLWDTDESSRVYGLNGVGAYVSSVAQLQATDPAVPQFTSAVVGYSIGDPNEGPLSGGTQVQFYPNPVGAGTAGPLDPTTEAYFGSTPATNNVVSVTPFASLTATAPAAAASGPVTVLLTDANNNAVLLPGGFSYGPQAVWIDPSAVPSIGGTWSVLGEYGVYLLRPTVTVGGVVDLNEPAGHAWPDGSMEMQVVPNYGTPGWADLNLTLQDGTSATTKNMVQFLAQDVTLTSPAYTSAVYDSSRDRFYLTGADNTIGVFNPETQTLLQPMQSSSISSGAVLGSLALTPDNSKLLVSDPTDRCVVVFNLTDGTSTAVNVLVASDGTAIISAPMPVAALSGNKALVILTPWATNEVREIDLSQMTVQVRTDVQGVGSPSIPPATMTSSADGSVALLGVVDAAWKYDTASDTFSAPMFISGYSSGDAVAVNGDGTVMEADGVALDQNLLPIVQYPYYGLRHAFTQTGGLLYIAAYVSGQVGIFDARNGTVLLQTPGITDEPPPVGAFAIDPTGQKILVSAGTSLYYYQLAVAPLSVGTVSPTAATPGTSLSIRGDGFVAGTTATIGGVSATCTMVDDQTLNCVVPNVNAGLAPMTLSNPDGQTYSLEAAVNIQ